MPVRYTRETAHEGRRLQARQYLGERISAPLRRGFSWSRLRQIAAFAGLAGAGWVLVLPALLLLALTLAFCGVFVPAAGLYQWIMSLQGQAAAGVGIALGGQMLPPGPSLAVSLPAGALLLLAAGGCWRGALACVAGLCRRQKAFLAEVKP